MPNIEFYDIDMESEQLTELLEDDNGYAILMNGLSIIAEERKIELYEECGEWLAVLAYVKVCDEL